MIRLQITEAVDEISSRNYARLVNRSFLKAHKSITCTLFHQKLSLSSTIFFPL